MSPNWLWEGGVKRTAEKPQQGQNKEQQTEMCIWQSGHKQTPRDVKIQSMRKSSFRERKSRE